MRFFSANYRDLLHQAAIVSGRIEIELRLSIAESEPLQDKGCALKRSLCPLCVAFDIESPFIAILAD
jgi:hypothetical protein